MKICIDPGHGGIDPGAVGINGVLEKNIALDISLKLTNLLKKYNYEVILTRDSDILKWERKNVSSDLKARCDIANVNKCDIFVSIHCNSSQNNNATGIETYYYKTQDKSKELAEIIQQNLIKYTKLINRGVKRANYYVLRNTTMPSVLIELGFINNEKDVKTLVDTKYQNIYAQAIYNGIKEYFKIK
ncbi:N-acetylmuramoyl-L-alanine amidase [Caldicellulosiruptoraceae bacterium PP1]